MDHLSPLDAAFMLAEDEDRNTSMAIASVAVLAGEPPGRDKFAEFVRGRLPACQRPWPELARRRQPDLRDAGHAGRRRRRAPGRARPAERAEDRQAGPRGRRRAVVGPARDIRARGMGDPAGGPPPPPQYHDCHHEHARTTKTRSRCWDVKSWRYSRTSPSGSACVPESPS